MSGRGTRQEIEIKLRLECVTQGRRLLRQAGFRVVRRRVQEDNVVFDTPRGGLRSTGELLRLRRAGRVSTLTFKGRVTRNKYKSRQELEVLVQDPGTLQAILLGLGFQPVFRYEKYRTEYQGSDSRGLAALDETSVGVFLELEGVPEWIESTARLLGYDEMAYITESYGSLYQSFLRQKGIQARKRNPI